GTYGHIAGIGHSVSKRLSVSLSWARCFSPLQVNNFSNVTLSVLHVIFAPSLLQDHRAPSVGFFLIACSSAVALLPVPSTAQRDLEWVGEVLGPVLCAFNFLWLSEDCSTAHILLIGSTLLPMLADWLSADGLVIMCRCVALSALSCSLTVCLFVGNTAGVVGSVALSLPTLLAPRERGGTVGSLISPKATGGLLDWIPKAAVAVGCWMMRRAFDKLLQDVK
ncbi:hypothetical protein P4O66_010460, partial [Electrophorus voltai]